MTYRSRKGKCIMALSSNASNTEMEVICKLCCSLCVPGDWHSLHNKHDRGFVTRGTEEKRGAWREDEIRPVLNSFITLFACSCVKAKTGTALLC
jgi:hypothetical protein